MSAAMPIQLFPMRGRTLLYTLLIAMLFIWPLMLFAASQHAAGVADGIRFMLNAACLLICAIGAFHVRGLARAREVIGSQQMPDALWRTWLRASVVETSLIWAFLGGTMSVLLASPSSATPWPAAFALLSASLCVGAIAMLSHHAMLPRHLRLPVNTVGGALLLAAIWLDAGQAVGWLEALPRSMLMLLALAWPALGAALLLSWRRQLHAYRNAPATPRSKLMAAIDSQVRRYSPLDWSDWYTWRRAPLQAPARSRFIWLANAAWPAYIFLESLTPLGWQQEPDARHLLSLVMLSILMTSALVARDLHWRSLLMPGGWRSGRIASDIFHSTLMAQYVGLALIAAGYILVQRVFGGTPIFTAVEAVADRVLVLAEIGLATSVALVLRAQRRPTLVNLGIAAVLGGCWIYMRWVVGYAALSHWPAGGALYATMMVAATFAILRVANRMWTPEKLLACARHGA